MKYIHNKFIQSRRVTVLSSLISNMISSNAKVLDIGTGSGEVVLAIIELRPDLNITGIDIKIRPETKIPVTLFDGIKINADDNQLDYSLLIDVIHHAVDPVTLIKEASRVSKYGLIIKDHVSENNIDDVVLSFMDYVGNHFNNVDILYNYFSLYKWNETFKISGLKIENMKRKLGIYPFPFNYVFDRNLHMLCLLSKSDFKNNE